ncbi:MAG: FAD-dependent oxidoreductase [Acidobacteriota bacterium]|nr:MAG: FAD-dependent oxidoreductase [Acidobacteriota bacterium]
MSRVKMTVDGNELSAAAGKTILEVARAGDIYIPALCAHPALPPSKNLSGESFVYRGSERIESDDPQARWDGCGICAVEVDGEIFRACATVASSGMSVSTNSAAVIARRREKLGRLLEDHPHACLTCRQAEGCSRTDCSSNVPVEERCCELLGSCELEKVARFTGVPLELPKYRPRGRPKLTSEPLFDHDTELCIGCLRCVRACREHHAIGALSFVIKDGRPVVGTTGGPTRAESHCRFCGSCVEVCPTGALTDKTRAVGKDRQRTLVPCRDACPAGMDIPRFVRHVAAGEIPQAAEVIRERIPLAHAASYACFHPCEEVCRRGLVNTPVSVCRLKRFTIDAVPAMPAPSRRAASGRKIAVVGGGPAGLTAAYYLALAGHDVTVHEALGEPGGMLRVGIPAYRFPRESLARDLAAVRAAGVQIRCDARIGPDKLNQLAAQNDAVFLATGAHRAKRINVPGADLEGVYWGLDFLREQALGRLSADLFRELRVVVIGGGNVAMDAARVARRLGAKDVCAVSLESPEQLPAWSWEVDEAADEGIRFLATWGPRELTACNGRVGGIALKRCVRVFDDEGRFRPAYDERESLELPAEAVILAVGQDPSTECLPATACAADGTVRIDEETLRTRLPKVYAGGDVASGPKSLIEAVAAGRRAATSIDRALGGDGKIAQDDEDKNERAAKAAEIRLSKVEKFAMLGRQHPVMAAASLRTGSFAPIEEDLTATAARTEAGRCLSCDLRLTLPEAPFPPLSTSLLALSADTVASVPATSGVFQLLDEDRKVITIKGVIDLSAALRECVTTNQKARFFIFEEEPMYTKRESELIQQYLQEHGELPGGGDDELDDLF